MTIVKYKIELSDNDRESLLNIIKTGSAPAKKILRANILLSSDQRNKDTYLTAREVADRFHTSTTTVQRVRSSYAIKGLEETLNRKKRSTPPVEPKITGEVEAHIIALACGEPPKGYVRWTLQLLAEKTVELHYVDSVSAMTVSRVLKKNQFKPHLKKCWCIPPKQNPDFVCYMEDVLSVYARPYNAEYPVVCMDEKPIQLLGNTRESFDSADGRITYEDNEYVRNGTASIFLFTEPLTGWRYADAQFHRTREDWAKQIEWLLTVVYPDAKKIVLVLDNLNTHTPVSLYRTFPSERARELFDRLEFHYTPKHGSWLDIAEIELSALGRQCLGKDRISDIETLRDRLKAWSADRNIKQKGVDWQFTMQEARVKLKHLYPTLNNLEDTKK